MAPMVRQLAADGLANVVGGCCGTNPEHIRHIAEAVASLPVAQLRVPPPPLQFLRLSGMTHFDVKPEANFVNIGERCNVAGSRAFCNLIKKNDMEAAVNVARKQVESGAQLLDINFDEGMLDGPVVMERFLNKIAVSDALADDRSRSCACGRPTPTLRLCRLWPTRASFPFWKWRCAACRASPS